MSRSNLKIFLSVSMALFLCLIILFSNTAWAADKYPDHEVRIIVPFGVGGGADRQARSVQKFLPDVLGVSVLVENHGGAGTKIGTKLFLKEPADGYTLMSFHQPSLTVLTMNNPGLTKIDDFAFININWIDPAVLIVHKDLGWKTMDDLIEACKKNPKKYSFSTSGIGTTADVIARRLMAKLGIELRLAHYKGGGKSRLSVKGHHTDMTASGAERVINIKDDVVALAHFWDKPVPLWPNAKPINEVLAKYNTTMKRIASISGFAVRKEIQTQYPERWEKLVSAFKKMTTEHKGYQAFCDKAQIGRLWNGPEETLKLVKEADEIYSAEKILKK